VTKCAAGREKAEAETDGAVVERDEDEGAEGPENERVCEARKWPFTDNFGLAEDLPEEVQRRLPT